MKRVLSLVLVLAMVLAMAPAVFAYPSSPWDEGWTYQSNPEFTVTAEPTEGVFEGYYKWMPDTNGTVQYTATCDVADVDVLVSIYYDANGDYEVTEADYIGDANDFAEAVEVEEYTNLFMVVEANFSVSEATSANITINANYVTAPGTKYNPIAINVSQPGMTFTTDAIGSYEQVWYAMNLHGTNGYVAVADEDAVIMTQNSGNYEDGVAPNIAINAQGLVVFAIQNNGNEAKTFDLTLNMFAGSESNPIEIFGNEDISAYETCTAYTNLTTYYTFTPKESANWELTVKAADNLAYGAFLINSEEVLTEQSTEAVKYPMTAGETYSVQIIAVAAADAYTDFTVGTSYVTGSSNYPVPVVTEIAGEPGTHTLTLEATEEPVYYSIAGVAGMELTVPEGVTVTYEDVEYAAGETVNLGGGQGVLPVVGFKTATAGEYALSFDYIPGTSLRPEEVDSPYDIYKELEDGHTFYYFKVKATEAGVYTFYPFARTAMWQPLTADAQIFVGYRYADNVTNDWGEIGYAIAADEGEWITIGLAAMDSNYNNVAGAVGINNFSFEPFIAQNGEDKYTSVADALTYAAEGDVIKLTADVEEDTGLVLDPGVTLELNGHTLTVPYLAAFEGNNVVDNGETKGSLVVAQNRLVLDKANTMMPIWDAENNAYVFVTVGKQQVIMKNSVTADGFMFVLEPTFEGTNYFADALGCSDNNVEIIVRLAWETSTGATVTQDFHYTNEHIQNAYSSGNTYLNVTVTGVGNTEVFKNLTATTVIVSGTGAEWTPATAETFTPAA